ncbi:methyltransferase domain-containing protein [Dermatophilaceae bacterium Soc4.6]
MTTNGSTEVDVVVVGGGAAGLSAATALARSRRSVVVVDAGEPRNAPSAGVHNYLGRDGVAPGELLASGRAELEAYGGVVVEGTATAARATGGGFVVTVDRGTQPSTTVAARRLVVTTGLRDELPEVAGLAQRWGRDVLHCPFCHGWEVRDQAIGILATGPMAVHQALLFRALSPDVTLFLHTAPPLTTVDAEQLSALGVRVVGGEVAGLDVEDDALVGIRMADGTVVSRQALVVAPRFVARSALLESLGLEVEDLLVGETVIGRRVAADPRGATAVPGVWVAGNVTDPMAQVVVAAGQGLLAGAAVHGDLVVEDTTRAVERSRATADFFSRARWEERYGADDHIWSGQPNPQLVAEVADLPPGSALDVGCGEGADALWLARRGWDVTGVDLSATALARAATQAGREGLEVTWEEADLGAWDAGVARFDLVSAQYFHWVPAPRHALFARLARAVRPGGTLLVVGHLFADPGSMPHEGMADMGYTAEQVAATLDPQHWEVLVSEHRARQRTHPETGEVVLIPDTVLRARRREARQTTSAHRHQATVSDDAASATTTGTTQSRSGATGWAATTSTIRPVRTAVITSTAHVAQPASEPPKICQASADFATRLSTR